jgi:plasmid stabilization system protein ParE
MKSYVLTPAAIQDLQEIRSYIADDNPAAARRVLEALRKAIRSLAKQPGTGHMRQDLADPRHRFLWSIPTSLCISLGPDHCR